MKTIYLLPWKFDNTHGFYKRKEFGTGSVFASIWKNSYTNMWCTSHHPTGTKYKTFEECANYFDSYLTSSYPNNIAERGGINFYLIKEDEINRFKEKLVALL